MSGRKGSTPESPSVPSRGDKPSSSQSRIASANSNSNINSSSPAASTPSGPPNDVGSIRKRSGSVGVPQKKVYPNGSSYIGQLNTKGRRHGEGTMIFKDGKYEGGWKSGKQHGKGTYVWNSNSKYEGEWKEGKFNGKGSYTWPSGANYTGEWAAGKKNGYGCFIWANGTRYEGSFQDDKKHGLGSYISGTDGTKYCGDYQNDQMHGQGTYLFPDGARYVGEFKNNNFDGRGTYTTPDGTCYVGEFKDDQRHGVGLLKTPHLGVFKVRYVAGKIVEHQDIVAWLKENHCGKYADLFKKEDITFDVLPDLDEEALTKLGVNEFGKRRKLLAAIEKLPVFDPNKRKGAKGAQPNLPNGPSPIKDITSSPQSPPVRPSNGTTGHAAAAAAAAPAPMDDEMILIGEDVNAKDYLTDDPFLVREQAEVNDDTHSGSEELLSSNTATGGRSGGGGGGGDSKMRDPWVGRQSLKSAVTFMQSIPEYREIKMDELVLDKRPIGRGVFGVVYRGEWRAASVAVKKLMGTLGTKELEELFKEATMLERLCHHPHVVAYIGIVKKPEVCLVTQWYPRGSIHDILVKNKEHVPWKTLVKMARDAASGILHLHREKVIHRDIASRNCLVDSNWRVCVTDFGLSRVKNNAYLQSNNNFGPVSWTAPEALLERKFSEKSDSYSFGVFLWEIAARDSSPYPGMSPYDIAIKVIDGLRPTIPASCPSDWKKLIGECVDKEVDNRPDFADLEQRLSAYYYCLPDEEAK